ncbi:MAG: dockerin type I repeat-containing protein [Clostridia bacterium]|nr:dockerin type I repeat-containing protein [Clostridia bacterium]
MKLQNLFKKTTACLLAGLMVLSAASFTTIKASAAENDLVSVSDSTTFRVGDNVTIKLGAKDYDGEEINSMYVYLVYTVKSIIGNKVSIETSYEVSNVSYLVKLDMHVNDIELKTYSDTKDDTDEEIVYVIGKGSDVLLKTDAIDQEKQEEIGWFWRLFSYTVDDISEDGIASISTRITLGYLEKMGISQDVIENMFNIENEIFKELYPLLTSVGYTRRLQVKLDDLRLQGNGVPSRADVGVYETKERLTVEASTYLASSGEKTEKITVPAGKRIVIVDYNNGYTTVYIKLNGKYYVTSKITINSCELVSKGRELFSSNGLEEGNYVKVTDIYGSDTDSFTGYEDFWFESVEGKEDYPLIYDVLYKIDFAYGDAAHIVPASPVVVNGNDVTALYTLALPAEYLKSAAGTYRTKTSVPVLKQTLNKDGGYDYEQLGSYASGTVFYSDGRIVDGYLHVRYNNYTGCVDVSKLEYVSDNVINYTNFRLGDVLYIRKGTTKDYDGVEIFADRANKNYFGVNYATDIYNTPFEVKFVANDWVELVETEESKYANQRDEDGIEFTVILSSKHVAKSFSNLDTDVFDGIVSLYGDANLDNTVNIEDVTYLQRHVASLIKLEGVALNNSDVTGDKKISMEDITEIQRYVAKLIKKFTAEK